MSLKGELLTRSWDSMHISIMASQWSAVSWYRLQLPSLILTVAEGWVKHEICSKGVNNSQKEREWRV